MTRLSAIAFGAALCAAMAAPAMAQDVVDPDEVERDNRGDIVVEGDRLVDGQEVGRLGRDITPRPSTSQDPLARFQRPICPGIWGLSPENAQLMIDRIYDNAERAGVEINDDPECGANVWVIFVDDPRETFQQLRDEEAFLVRGLDYWKRKAVTEQEGPVLAWSVVSIRNEEGIAIADPSTTALAATEARSGGEIPANPVTTMSRTRTSIRQDIEMSVMLVQRSAIAGLDAVALGDYATMRTLARTRPPRRENAYDTVLTLFDEDLGYSPPDRLTDFDLAYLQSLYASRADRPSRIALRNVDELMEIEARREE